MNEIPPERQLDILNDFQAISNELGTFHQCTVYDGFLEDLKYVKELIRRDIGLPVVREEKNLMLFRRCPKCNTVVDYCCTEEINYCKMCGQALDWSEE